ILILQYKTFATFGQGEMFGIHGAGEPAVETGLHLAAEALPAIETYEIDIRVNREVPYGAVGQFHLGNFPIPVQIVQVRLPYRLVSTAQQQNYNTVYEECTHGLQVKNFIALMEELDHIFGSFPVGVTDEYLPKIVLFDQAHQLGAPVFIQLVKDVVQKENGSGAPLLLDKMELGQFKGDQKGFLLPLAPELLYGMSGYGEFQIVLMGAHRVVLQYAVPFQIGLQQPQKVTVRELAPIGEHDLLVPL